jgi:hypothetical protein
VENVIRSAVLTSTTAAIRSASVAKGEFVVFHPVAKRLSVVGR